MRRRIERAGVDGGDDSHTRVNSSIQLKQRPEHRDMSCPIFPKPTSTRRTLTPILQSKGLYPLFRAKFIFYALPLALSGFKIDHDRMHLFKIAEGGHFSCLPLHVIFILSFIFLPVRIQVLLKSNPCKIRVRSVFDRC